MMIARKGGRFALLLRLRHSLMRMLFPPLRREAVEARLDAYLRTVAAPALHLPAEGFAPPHTKGHNTLVLRWQTAARGTLFARGWRYDRMQRPAHEHRTASELFAAAGRCVPTLLWCDDTWRTLRRWRVECTIEQAACGTPLSELLAHCARNPPEVVIDALAREIAGLHTWRTAAPGVAAPTGWGKPWRPLNELAEPRAYWQRRLAELRERLPAGVRRLTPERVEKGLDVLERELPELHWQQAPVLIHGDLAPWHLFFSGPVAAPQFMWIDFGTVQWGHPAVDLAAVRGWLAPPAYARFAAGYADAGGPAHALERRALDWFKHARQLEKLGTRMAKMRHRRHPTAEQTQQLADLERYLAKWLKNPEA
jgi:hypothetical protein